MSKKGWQLEGVSKTFDLSKIEDSEELKDTYRETVFYKDRWINEGGLEQHLIVTYSLKYKEYQQQIRERQVERALGAGIAGLSARGGIGYQE